MTRAGTRSSARNPSSPKSSQDQNGTGDAAGTKRKADASTSPANKRGKTAKVGHDNQQQTIDQTMPDAEETSKQTQDDNEIREQTNDLPDKDMEEAADQAVAEADEKTKGEQQNGGAQEEEQKPQQKSTRAEEFHEEKMQKAEEHHAEQGSKMDSAGDVHKTKDDTAGGTSTKKEGAVESSQGRGEAMPSNILEKGIIYFFVRGRVGTDQPSGIQDIARSYIVLRPLPQNAKLGEGPVVDQGNNRLLALPKKVLPRSHRDTFMTFVDKAGVSIEELKQDVFQGSTYSTATTGVRHAPTATPVGEGIYAITTTGRESHLAYMLTIPAEMGEVQEEIGLSNKGSFVLSTKNPEQKGPANANLPQGPAYPDEIREEFRGLRWFPTQPKHLDYANAQFLMIGEGHGEIGKAVQAEEKDEKSDTRETPNEEMEKLEGEDEMRVEGLNGDDTVFDDLGMSSKEYPKVQTTW